MPDPAPPQCLGQILQARFDYMRRVHGDAAPDRVVRTLPSEDRDRLRTLSRDAWYPFATLMRLDRAIADVLVPGDPTVFEKLGEASSRHRTEWLGEHAGLVNVHGFLSRVAEEHRRFHSFGRASYHRTGFNEGELTFSDYPEKHDIWCASSKGYFRGAVAFLTGAPAVVDEPRCQCRGDETCVFRLRWTPKTEAHGGNGDNKEAR